MGKVIVIKKEQFQKRIPGCKLLNYGYNHKTVKGDESPYYTGILYLAPAKESGYEMCPNRTPLCTALCLSNAGFGSRPLVKNNRIKRTKMFVEDKPLFWETLCDEIMKGLKYTEQWDQELAIRLNGTSDIDWTQEMVRFPGVFRTPDINIMQVFPMVQFYDYTKNFDMMQTYLRGFYPPNYHLTFSLSEENQADAKAVLKCGGNVAVVFEDEIPETFWGYPVESGDEDDLRFLNSTGTIIGLKYKVAKSAGSGKRNRMDKTGFVYRGGHE